MNAFYGDAPGLRVPELIELRSLTRHFLASPQEFAWLLAFQRDQMQVGLTEAQKARYHEFLGPTIDSATKPFSAHEPLRPVRWLLRLSAPERASYILVSGDIVLDRRSVRSCAEIVKCRWRRVSTVCSKCFLRPHAESSPSHSSSNMPGDKTQTSVRVRSMFTSVAYAKRLWLQRSSTQSAPCGGRATLLMAVQALAVWLETFHPTMPNLLVGKKDRDDAIAYIMSYSLLPGTDTQATCRRQTCAWV
jgi:hypothetical protein